jgi:double-strand break repair helicase AddA
LNPPPHYRNMDTDRQNQITKRATDTSKSVHLSASAGSGKTRALKGRYLALLDALDNRSLNIDQVVAITFTDKAAAEIKERVMRSLPEAMLKKIIRGRQDLRISTIHSFCMNLLKRYPIEAGLPPDFGVLDARDQGYKIQKAIEDALEASDTDQELMASLGNVPVDDLVALIGFLLSIRSRLKRMEIDAGGADDLLKSVREGMGTEHDNAELQDLVRATEWGAAFRQMEVILRRQGDRYVQNRGRDHLLIAGAQNVNDVVTISASLVPLYFTADGQPRKNPAIAKKTFLGNDREAYEKAYVVCQEMLGRLRRLYSRISGGRKILSLITLFQRADRNYQVSKLREGLLDFDDLEVFAYRLLQGMDSPDILYWLDRKILHFLVDEFQDTSDIQWAILNKLTEEIFSGLGADKRMSPTLFVVGDEKQSIYRFREANYRLMERVREKMVKLLPAGTCDILTLHKNYRSTEQIVETVNQVFAHLWEGSYRRSDTDRSAHRGSVMLIEVDPGNAEQNANEPAEAEVLAREIRKCILNKTPVYEKSPESLLDGATVTQADSWSTRPAGFADCAILIQSRTKLKEYEAALQKEGVPFRVVGGIGFYEEDEIQALLNILFFLWNRDDELSLAAALKSPLFSLTDKDIFDLKQGDAGMLYSLSERMPEVWGQFHRWERNAGLAPLADLIHAIIEDTGAYVRFGRRNAQAIFNIDKLLDSAREFDRRGYTTLQDFVEWVKNIRASEQREAAADMNLPGFQGAVSIMTVHKAKGLEFPIVLLPGMNQQPKSAATGPLVLIESNDGTQMAVKDGSNPLYNEMWGREKIELQREHQRLLYVAMTRARDHLVMIGTVAAGKSPVKQNTWLDYLHEASPRPLFDAETRSQDGLLIYAWPPPVPPAVVKAQSAPPADGVELNSNSNRFIDFEQIISNVSPIPPSKAAEWKKATDFIDHDQEELYAKYLPETGANSVSPLTRGSVLHRCLETYTKTGTYDLRRIISEFPDITGAETIRTFILDVETVMSKVLKRRELAWIFEPTSDAYSELAFLYGRGASLVSGIIDRVVIKDDKAHVIDYKAIFTDNDESLAAWKNHYRPQIQIYCEAVKELFKLPHVKGYILFLDSARLEATTEL